MEDQIIQLLERELNLGGRSRDFTRATPLLGAVPELDSLAVASILGQIEVHFKIHVEDDEIDGSVFETVGSLADFIKSKISQS